LKIVTMHQPNYLPWIGLFSKISRADCFIIYDTAQFTTKGVIDRNKVRTNAEWCYLSIPIPKIYRLSKISEVALPENRDWQKAHWRTIYLNYLKTDYFKEHKYFFEEIYKTEFKYLWQLNEKILLYLLECFKIKVEVVRASKLGVNPDLRQTDMIVACLKNAGADVYLSGPSGRTYLEMDKFSQNNIDLKFFKFQHPVYPQRYPGFEPNMSAIDLLFNMGSQSEEIVKNSGSIQE
jgi:hypothetical protein